MTPFLSKYSGQPYDTERAMRLADARQHAEDREADYQAALENNRRFEMATRKTKFGPVKRPPSLDDDRKQADQWSEQINEAIDVARQVADREKALSDTNVVDPKRFPLIGRQ